MLSSSRSSQRAPSRPRRPASPVSMYGSGSGFGVGSPRSPRPLVRLEKKPQATHTRSPSISTTTSGQSESSSSNSASSSASMKSAKSFGLPQWRKRGRPSTATTPSPPVTPMSASTDTTPTRRPNSNPSMEFLDLVLSEAESRVRQLDKAARTLGERVPVEYILHGQRNEPPTGNLPPSDEPADPVLPADDLEYQQRPVLTHIDVPAANSISTSPEGKSPASSCGTSSPVLPSEDYDELKRTQAPAPSSTTQQNREAEPESPILFFSSPDLPTKKQISDTEPTNTNAPTPFVLRHPRPKPGTWSQVPSPSSTAFNKTPSIENGVDMISTTNTTSLTNTTTPIRRSRSSLIRPKSSYAGSTSFWGEPASPHPRPDSPFQESIPIQTWLTTTTWTSPTNGCVVRQECGQGWSGEWNRSDMQDVITKLRQLK